MARLLTTIQKSVAGYVLMPTDPEVIDAASVGVNLAIDILNTNIWNWGYIYDDITFVEDVTDYELQAWFKAPIHFEIQNASGNGVSRLVFKPWKDFLVDHQNVEAQGDPKVYSVANLTEFGTVSLNAIPTTGWIAQNPTGRIWYFHNIPHPTQASSIIDVPDTFAAYIQAYAEGYVADRFAVQKAGAAYGRASALYDPGSGTGALVRADSNVQTDWE